MSHNPNFLKKIFHISRRVVAKNWLNLMPIIQIAITGSQGKTNTSYIVKKILPNRRTVLTDTNLDTIYNVPITALKTKPWTKYVIFELGVDHLNEMDIHLQIVKPKIAIITGISTVHTDDEHFGSLNNLITEKTKLIRALPNNGFAILNYDDQYVRKMINQTKAQIIFYGSDKKNCQIYFDPKEMEINLLGIKANIYDNKKKIEIKSQLIGNHQIYNIMAAYAVSKILDIPQEKFIKKLHEIKPLTGRMSLEHGPRETLILNDGLRANPISTKFGLETLSNIKLKKGNKIAILAEMGELVNPEEEHRNIGKLINKLNINSIICIGPNQKYVYDEILNKSNAFWAKDVFEAAKILNKIAQKNDLIYLKGSLLRHVERVIMLFGNKKITCGKTVCENYSSCSKCKKINKV